MDDVELSGHVRAAQVTLEHMLVRAAHRLRYLSANGWGAEVLRLPGRRAMTEDTMTDPTTPPGNRQQQMSRAITDDRTTFDKLADEAERGYDPNLIRQTRPATVQRYRVTVRGTGIELRGWVDDPEQVMRLGKVMSIFTEGAGLEPGDPMVVTSPASADYDPFRPNRDALLELADAMDADRYPGSDLVRSAADR